jgi:hypothetical protein
MPARISVASLPIHLASPCALQRARLYHHHHYTLSWHAGLYPAFTIAVAILILEYDLVTSLSQGLPFHQMHACLSVRRTDAVGV